MDERRRAAAHRSIEGLAFGDAFGERFFRIFRPSDESRSLIAARRIPPDPHWHWTDYTAMALDLLAILEAHGEVAERALVERFAATYRADPGRGYGSGMHALLPRVAASPEEWETLAGVLFGGEGSLGNGAAMRVAPLGAWFHDDLERAAEQAALPQALNEQGDPHRPGHPRPPRGHRGRGRGGRRGGPLGAWGGAGPLRRRRPYPRRPGAPRPFARGRAAPGTDPATAAETLGSGHRILPPSS